MFDIGWQEMLVVAIVLIVVVGPKDLPRMLRQFGRTTSKFRAMANDFRKQFDEALKEAELDDVKNIASDMRKLNPAADLRKALNPMQKAAEDVRAGLDKAMKPQPAPEKPADAAAAVEASTTAETVKPNGSAAPVAEPAAPAKGAVAQKNAPAAAKSAPKKSGSSRKSAAPKVAAAKASSAAKSTSAKTAKGAARSSSKAAANGSAGSKASAAPKAGTAKSATGKAKSSKAGAARGGTAKSSTTASKANGAAGSGGSSS